MTKELFMHKNRLLALFILLACIPAVSQTKQLKTSVIIPCHPKHAIQLYPLLEQYAQQTILPDEVVISISEINAIDPTLIGKLKDAAWPFSVNLITSDKKQFAGQNHNIACSQATGDIFICQDADDIPHPQRIEIILYCFEKYDIDHLIHEWQPLPENNTPLFMPYDFKQHMKSRIPRHFNEVWIAGRIHNGNIAISKKVFNKLKWPDNPRGQDVYFNINVYNHFKKRMIIYMPLVIYRQQLSSLNKSENI